MDLQARINRLQELAGSTPIEDQLLHEAAIDVTPNATHDPGSMTTWLVTLESRREAIFKKLGNVKVEQARLYSHDRVEANVHEVVAWRLAHVMGDPWDQLLPTAVLRTLGDIGPGVLCNRREGSPNRAVFYNAKTQAAAAAFWDCLVGQQDRHANQFRFDADKNRLALIDHAFAFARPGDRCHASMFLRRRKSAHEDRLTSGERAVLENLLGDDLHGLRGILAIDRADAVEARAKRMLDTDRLLLPGAF